MRILVLNTDKPLQELIKILEHENLCYHVENFDDLYILNSDSGRDKIRLFTQYLAIGNQRNVLRNFDVVAFIQNSDSVKIFSFQLFLWSIHKGMDKVNGSNETALLGSSIKKYENDSAFYYAINQSLKNGNCPITIDYI